MARQRIAVGLDGSASARAALAWAARVAARHGAGLLVVTAWPDAARDRDRATGHLARARERLDRMQRTAIEAATAGPVRIRVVAREIVLGDPVAALCHAGALADLVVVGGDPGVGPAPESVAVTVARRLAGSTRRGPAVVSVTAAHVGDAATASPNGTRGRVLRPCPEPPAGGRLETRPKEEPWRQPPARRQAGPNGVGSTAPPGGTGSTWRRSCGTTSRRTTGTPPS
ncbi:universal stress protein [Plantactinospora sp. B5E13]|uniref:universal stress protein n=1 Tax=Plantactinospora sp. B5E13 TaxID=3153758 RepID=UPI00325CFFF5